MLKAFSWVTGACLALILSACNRPDRPAASDSSLPARDTMPMAGLHYVGRQACAACHAEEAAAWAGSDHDHAMEEAGEASVLGRFEGDSLIVDGKVSRFYRKDGAFMVHTEGPGGIPGDFRIRYTFGYRPLQQYLVEFPGGRMQALPLAWDTRKKAWFHLQAGHLPPPDDWLHWTKDGQNWNGMCADCHSTGLERGYDAAAKTFRTTWKEIDVSCEACHGPGSEHMRYEKTSSFLRKLPGQDPGRRRGLRADWQGGEAHAEVMACGRCHARRTALQEDFQGAKEFLDAYVPDLLREGIYHADGQILDEDYEYGSFLQSRMHKEGVRCSDCHDPHSLKTRAPGNALCTRCHEPARFDAPVHHRHAPSSAGSLCVECHMPSKYYMQADLRRDHSLRIPRPDLTVRFGTPNACNGCHGDKDAAWAAAKVAEWHGPARKPNFSELLAAGRSGLPGSETSLVRLAGDTSSPAIARATAVSLLSGYMDALSRAALKAGTGDKDALVRRASALALESSPPEERIPALVPLLKDSLRAVRTAAAQALADAAPALPAPAGEAWRAAEGEFRRALAAEAFFPGGRFNEALHFEKTGQAEKALTAYLAALEMDNRFIQARINAGRLSDRLGRPAEAERHFREALRLNPEYKETHYMLGLFWAGQGRLDSAAAALEASARALPAHARTFYNLGLIRHRQERMEAAEKALAEAARLEPAAADYLYTMAWFHSTRNRWDKALEWVERVAAVDPAYPGLQALARRAAARSRKP